MILRFFSKKMKMGASSDMSIAEIEESRSYFSIGIWSKAQVL